MGVRRADERRGEVIAGKYRIVDVLGRGGNADTFRVEDLESGAALAVKELRLGNAADWKVVELFEREARVLSELSHTAIPRYVAYHQIETDTGPSFYLVQELAPGRPLTRWLEDGWRPDEAAIKQIAEQVLVVLGYLHALQPAVIHRDLKPQNLIRDDDGTIRVVDFGAVQAAVRDPETGGSTLVGTYGFMAPEQSRGLATPATDLFGLGATLLFLLTRKTVADFPHKKMRIDFRSATTLSPSFAGWLEQMLEPDPERRFASAAAARRALVTNKSSPRGSATRTWVLAGAAVALGIGALAVRPLLRPTEDVPATAAQSATGAAASAEPAIAQVRWELAIPAHFSAVFSVDLSPDGQTIASSSHDGTVKLWDAGTGALVATLAGHEGTVGGVQLAPDGKTLYTADSVAVRAWDLATRTQRLKMVGHTAQVSSVAVSPDGKRLASTGFDGSVRIWDAQTGKALLVLAHAQDGSAMRVFCAAFSPDGGKLVSAGGDGRINAWNALDGTPLRTFKGHRGNVGRVAVAADGQTIVSVGDDGTLRAWSLRGGDEIYRRAVGRGELWALSISPDGQTIATGGQDGVVRVWNLMSGRVTRAFADQTGGRGTLSVDFRDQGGLLVTGGGDGRIKTWNLGGRERVEPTGVAATEGDEDAGERPGWQPLHVAAWDGDGAQVKKLLATHPTVDERNAYGRTPLYLAAKRGHLEIVKMLAAAGANVDAPARGNMTPLWPAVQNGNLEVVRWLLDHGADPSHVIDVRQSALYKAAETGRVEIARLLIARKVAINDGDRFHWTPLGVAAKNGHADLVELLASQPGIELNSRNGKASVTPMQLAAQAGHAGVVDVLIAKGADVNDRGGEKWSPLEAAQQLGYPTIAARLKAAGAH